MSSAALPQAVTGGLHMPSSSQIQRAKLLPEVKSGTGSPDWNMSVVDIHRKLLWVHCPGHTGDWRGKATTKRGLRLGKIGSVEELETLPAGSKPRTLHHRSPGGERRGKRKC